MFTTISSLSCLLHDAGSVDMYTHMYMYADPTTCISTAFSGGLCLSLEKLINLHGTLRDPETTVSYLSMMPDDRSSGNPKCLLTMSSIHW